jgi:hypothetical protein
MNLEGTLEQRADDECVWYSRLLTDQLPESRTSRPSGCCPRAEL